MAPTLKSVSKALRPIQGSAAELVLTIVTTLFLLVVLPHQSLVPLPNDDVDVSNYAWPLNFAKEPVFRCGGRTISNLLFAAANSIKDASRPITAPAHADQGRRSVHDKLSDADIGVSDHPLARGLVSTAAPEKNTSTGGRARLSSPGALGRSLDPQSGDPKPQRGSTECTPSRARQRKLSGKSVTTQHPKTSGPGRQKGSGADCSDHGACAFTMEGCPRVTHETRPGRGDAEV